MDSLDLVRLSAVMERSRGSADVVIALVDGPVAVNHPDLAAARIRALDHDGACALAGSYACAHGTFVAGVLVGQRGSSAPAIAPDCTLLVSPIFGERASNQRSMDGMPSATPNELATAVRAAVDAGARVVNISAALLHRAVGEERALTRALDDAACRGTLVVAAAGNQALVGSSPLTRHPWVIPVAACDTEARPSHSSNLGRSIGNGLLAPGERVVSLGTNGRPRTFSGTSAATPFVTGAIALLCSLFPRAPGDLVRWALYRDRRRRRIVPPLLDAWGAYQALETRLSNLA